MNFGKKLHYLRTKKGIRQKQLAAELLVSPSTISNYENSIHHPDPEILCKIARYFHVSTDYLLGRTQYCSPIDKLGLELANPHTNANILNILPKLHSESRRDLIQYLTLLKLYESEQWPQITPEVIDR